MNASEVLKGFAMKQVYSYLDRDPEANLPNLLDMLEKYDKNGQAVTTQVEGIRAALSDPNNNWSKLVKSLWTDIDDEQRKKLVETVVINGTLIDDAFADEMLRVKNLVPAISIEGFEEATDFRRGEGTYRKVIEAMTRLKERKLLFGISCCYTSKNVEVIGSEEYFDSMIDMGAKFAWLFTYMPMSRSTSSARPSPSLRWTSGTTATRSAAASPADAATATSMPTATWSPAHSFTTPIPTSRKKRCLSAISPRSLWPIAAASPSMTTCCVPAPCWITPAV